MLSFSPKTFFLSKCFVLFNNYKTISIAGKILWSQKMATLTPIGKWRTWLVIFKLFVFCYSARPMQNITGKSLSEALIFALTNPQYDDRLFIVHENCKLRIPAEHVVYTNCCFCFVLTFRTILVHNMFCRCCELLKKIYLYFWRNLYVRLRESPSNLPLYAQKIAILMWILPNDILSFMPKLIWVIIAGIYY